MSNNASYIMLSRQAALMRQMSVLANNIANTDTSGFKTDKMVYQTFEVKSGGAEKADNKLSFPNDVSTYTDFAEGEYETTGRQLDASISGDGFFIVRTPLGERYTRAGNFQTNSEGVIVTAQGYPVLGPDRQEIAFQEEDVNFIIKEDGTISVGQDDRGQLGVVRFKNPQLLEKTPNNLYKSEELPFAATEDDNRVMQGILERSNVSPIKELTDMIEVSRAITSASRFQNDLHELARRALTAINRQT